MEPPNPEIIDAGGNVISPVFDPYGYMTKIVKNWSLHNNEMDNKTKW